MSAPAADTVTFEPLHVGLTSGSSISGMWLRGEGQVTILFLHDRGADLDAVLPLLAGLRIPEAHKVAIDLPGHGLSEGAEEDAEQSLSMLCDALAADGHGPFVVVGCGHAARLAWVLGGRDDVLGVSLVSPVLDGPMTPEPFRRAPVLVFLAAASPEVVAAWNTLKTRLRARWLSASLAITHDELLGLRGCDSQVASHIGGFARDLMANAPAATGQRGA